MLSRHCRIGQWKGIGGESGEHQQYPLNGGSQTIVVGPKGPGILKVKRPKRMVELAAEKGVTFTLDELKGFLKPMDENG